jgi:hypothetical protein
MTSLAVVEIVMTNCVDLKNELGALSKTYLLGFRNLCAGHWSDWKHNEFTSLFDLAGMSMDVLLDPHGQIVFCQLRNRLDASSA